MVGTTNSHYKVLEKIGEGGMGEVYRATDTKLNRDVALKILPEQFASDSQRMARFQREAEVLASLDHPNIGQILGHLKGSALRGPIGQKSRETGLPVVCPGRDSNPHEGNPHRILSPVRLSRASEAHLDV